MASSRSVAPVRVFHIGADHFVELDAVPDRLPDTGYLWVGSARREFETHIGELQAALERWTGGQLVDLHVSDLLNPQLPSHYDYTSWYDVLVFRRLVAGASLETAAEAQPAPAHRAAALPAIDTSPVGFALFDRVLLTVHPADCAVRDAFAARLSQLTTVAGPRQEAQPRLGASRLPPSPADLMLRMVNQMVDGYLELRRLLTRQLGQLQQDLFNPRGRFDNWQVLLESRNSLHMLEDVCEDQRSAVVEWIDALDEWPQDGDPAAARERELLRVRSRDVLEHIERVLGHVRRLESSAESSVQMHFSAQSNRTNDIMRTLTVLTAIFMPLNLVTGFFGMNFDTLPLVHDHAGVWFTTLLMVVLGGGLSLFFWRKRYLTTRPR